MDDQLNIDEQKMETEDEAMEQEPTHGSSKKKIIKVSVAISAVFVLLYFANILLGQFRGPTGYQIPTYTVENELMRVTVTAGGALQALRSHEVQSKVEGSTQILNIIPEGTVITEADVEEGIVLMELDASDARERLEQQKITVEDASASYTQAKEDHTIQKEQNESDISQAELNVRFTLMELQRYLGDALAERAVDGGIDFESREWQEDIGGAALQRRRELENAVSLAGEELTRTQENLHWTRELVNQGFVNRNELVADELEEKRRKVQRASAEEDLELFLRYTLVKEAEERLSDYIESKRNLERTRARARGRMAQAEAKLRSRRSSYGLQEERLERLEAMIEHSTVRASRTGLVVYASTTDPRHFRNSPVQEGLNVRQGQTIITIPDLSTLAARVEVPETQAQMVRAGQTAEISIDAMSDNYWKGEVRRISPMAAQQTGFSALTGGAGGYETDVIFTELGGNTDLKPGMSATVEIEVARIPDALSLPIHAVHTRDGRRVCWVAGAEGPELREVELGYYTDTHVEIRRGLKENEQVMLAQPETVPRDVRVILLPERDVESQDDDMPDIDPPPGLEAPEAEEPEDNDRDDDDAGEQIERILEGVAPELRRRIEERLQDPERRERLMEQLKDPESREKMLERMQDPASGERRQDGRGRR